jgi:hypothetical protein
MKQLAIASLVTVAACTHAAPGPAIVRSAPMPAVRVPAAHYAALFTRGASWRYHVTTTSEIYDPDASAVNATVRSESTSEARCTVAETQTWPGGVMSRIECDKPLGEGELLSGAWAADERGLWRIDDLPAPGAAPTLERQPVISAAPVEGKHETHGTGDEEGFGEATEVTASAGGWCTTHSSWGGDESYTTLCFGRGVVFSGGSGWSGGSSHDTAFELVP